MLHYYAAKHEIANSMREGARKTVKTTQLEQKSHSITTCLLSVTLFLSDKATMAEVAVHVADSSTKATRRSFNREFKLAVIEWFYANNKNVLQTASKFQIDRKQVRQWTRNEEKIRKQKRKSKSSRSSNPKYPLLEKRLQEEFRERRTQGKIVKKWWFISRARQILSELHPTETTFKFSDRWFSGFCRRNKLTLRRKTHVAQKSPSLLEDSVKKFHAKLQRERKRGTYKLGDIANMDQTPLPFVLNDGKTYDPKGSKEVWCTSGPSGLDKRQCTVQLTIFGDGVPRVKPTVIFRGKGKRIKPDEKKNWDKRVKVYFQPNAWCDESIMKQWVADEWGNVFTNSPSRGSSGKILVADVHTAQQTDAVKRLLQMKKTVLVNVPPGCTSLVQPLDVSVNKPFKGHIREQLEKHLDENLDRYAEGNLTASERRVLTTKWVGNAWETLCKNNKEMVIRSFVKCGITNKLDGSEDDQVNIRGLEGYKMPLPEDEFHLETSSEEEDQDSEQDGFITDISVSSGDPTATNSSVE